MRVNWFRILCSSRTLHIRIPPKRETFYTLIFGAYWDFRYPTGGIVVVTDGKTSIPVQTDEPSMLMLE